MGAPKKKINKTNIFALCFLILILIRPAILLYQNREPFFYRNYQYEPLKRAYETSQYVTKINPGIIPDQTMEAYAGGALIRGANPILVLSDQPPLGLYLIGLSIIIFDNAITTSIILLGLSAFGVFLIAKASLKNSLLALVPLAVFLNEPLFLNTAVNLPLIEPIQLPFIIFALYFFIRANRSKNYTRWFILVSVMLGAVISTRFFILGAFLLLAFIAYLLLERDIRKIFAFVLTLPISLAVLIASYFKTIMDGYALLSVFSIQKYIYTYHKSEIGIILSFWDLLIFNRWHTWWADRAISSDVQWIIAWPISTILSILFFLEKILKKKLENADKIILFWIISYCALLSVGNVSVRYFMPLLPFIYIIATKALYESARKYIIRK
ncbi:MAG: hypothetical protein WD992_03275 [Candidatus Levyibacteriota bacterium]